MNDKKEICQICNGAGKITRRPFIHNVLTLNGNVAFPVYGAVCEIDCPACNTTGHVKQILHKSKYTTLCIQNGWEFCERNDTNKSVGIIAITDEKKLILVKQFRTPIGLHCIELPCGLWGDSNKHETSHDAARRELLEETGYEAKDIIMVGTFTSSPGMLPEEISVFLATHIKKIAKGGGIENEKIEVLEVSKKDLEKLIRSTFAIHPKTKLDCKVLLALPYL